MGVYFGGGCTRPATGKWFLLWKIPILADIKMAKMGERMTEGKNRSIAIRALQLGDFMVSGRYVVGYIT